MEHTNQPNPSQEPSQEVHAIEARLSVLERQLAERSATSDATSAEDRRMDRIEQSAELEHHRDQLRDYEKALVERIADVDDDRRATASRLQRAWQTQREEIDERLRRHAGLLGGLLMLFAILFAIAFFLVYRQATMGQPPAATAVSEMRQQPARSPADVAIAEQARVELDGLKAKVGEIASALQRLDTQTEQAARVSAAAEQAAREGAEGRFAAEVRRLDAEQERLSRSLASLGSDLQVLGVGRAGKPTGIEAEVAEEGLPENVGAGLPEQEVREGGERVAGAVDVSAVEGFDAGVSGSAETLIVGGDIYALQLIGFFNRKSLDELVDQEGLPARVYSVRQTYKGRPWYVLIHSLYDDYAAAEEALARLPADLAQLNPWIRPLSEGTELQIIQTRQGSE